MGPKDVAVMLRVSNATGTKLVDRLVSNGHLRRLPHPHDRRAIVLQPIDGARQNIEDAYARFHQIVVRVVESIPDIDNAVFAQRLNQIASALDADGPRAHRLPDMEAKGRPFRFGEPGADAG